MEYPLPFAVLMELFTCPVLGPIRVSIPLLVRNAQLRQNILIMEVFVTGRLRHLNLLAAPVIVLSQDAPQTLLFKRTRTNDQAKHAIMEIVSRRTFFMINAHK